MKSRTSFFNLTVFRKNITRFAPVWALYTVFLLLILFAVSGQESGYMARDVLMITSVAGVGNLLYAGIVAMCLFGDLYNGRLCNALHAFPMRREGWLLTNVATGFLFSLVPNLLICTLTSFQLGEYAHYVWYLFGIATLQYLFFFGTAVLSALCAGNKLGMLAVYGMIHFIVLLIYFLAELIYQPLIYGIELQTDKFFRFFPLNRMYTEYVVTEFGYGEPVFLRFNTEAWTHLYICAAVGVAAFALAWLTYRRRHLEQAGNFIALRPLAPVFLCIYTIAVGAVFYAFSGMFNEATYVLYAAGIVIGFFTGQMLLNRTVRVFTKKSWLAFGLLAIVLSGTMALTWLDPMGIGSYVPSLDAVKSAAIYGPDKSYYYYDGEEYDTFALTDLDEIKQLQDFHKELFAERPAGDMDYYDVRIRYNLTDGSKVERFYKVHYDSKLTEKANKWFSDPRYIFQMNDTQFLYSALESCSVEMESYDENGNWAPKYRNIADPEAVAGLLDAILADCAAGNMGQAWIFHDETSSVYNIRFNLKDNLEEDYEEYRFTNISIFEDSENTIAYLEEIFAELPDDDNYRVG